MPRRTGTEIVTTAVVAKHNEARAWSDAMRLTVLLLGLALISSTTLVAGVALRRALSARDVVTVLLFVPVVATYMRLSVLSGCDRLPHPLSALRIPGSQTRGVSQNTRRPCAGAQRQRRTARQLASPRERRPDDAGGFRT